MAEPLAPGDPRQLGPYFLDGRLGAGGQGVVYEGYGPAGERVAVKALHGVTDHHRELLRREVDAWRQVAPFCTAAVLHTDLDGPVPYVVSEHVPGPDLEQAVARNGPLGDSELLRLAIGMATALVAIHRSHVVHRDLKPANVLLGPDGPRVIDFGIAATAGRHTTTGVVRGTLRYMAPERFDGQSGDGKTDIWGWGALVYFAATGSHPFDGEDIRAIQAQVALHHPDASALPEPLRTLVPQALAKDPADRPTATELLYALAGGTDPAEGSRRAAPRNPAVPDTLAEDLTAPSRAERAEAAYAELTPAARDAAPRLLLRLVAPGDTAADTLRTARRAELGEGEPVDELLDAFAEAGVLAVADEHVSLAAAALVRAWPRLRAWARDEGDGLGVHQALVAAVRLWHDHGRKAGDLYQGSALERARTWAATERRHLELNTAEREFLAESGALSRRRGRTRAVLSLVLAVLLIAATGTALYAFDQQRTVTRQRNTATSAQVAGLAESLGKTDPQLARRLAVAAEALGHTPEAWSALLSTRYQREKSIRRIAPFDVKSSDLDSDGGILVASGGTEIGTWDTRTGRRLGTVHTSARVRNVVISDDGSTVAASTDADTTTVYNTRGLRPRTSHTYRTNLALFRLSPKGTYLVAHGSKAGKDDRDLATLWNTHTGAIVLQRTDDSLGDPSFSPDEKILSLVAGRGGTEHNGTTLLWVDTRTRKNVPAPKLPAGASWLSQGTGPVAFSPDGRELAMPVNGKLAVTYPPHPSFAGALAATLPRWFRESPEPDTAVHFSPDGTYIAAGFTVWQAVNPDAPEVDHPTILSECSGYSSRFSADGKELSCLGDDGKFRTLDLTRLRTRIPDDAPLDGTTVQASQDGSTLADKSSGTVRVWSTRPLAKRAAIALSQDARDGFQLSPDGRLIAVGTHREGQVDIWNTVTRKRLGTLPGNVGGTTTVAFSPDGRKYATYDRVANKGAQGIVDSLRFYDLRTMKLLKERQFHLKGASIDFGTRIQFRPDSRAVVVSPLVGAVAFPSGKVLAPGTQGLHLSGYGPGGRTAYTDPDSVTSTLTFLDPHTLKPKGETLDVGGVAAGPDHPVAHGPDGRLLAVVGDATAGSDELPVANRISLWDLRNRRQLGADLVGDGTANLSLVTFTRDSSRLIAVDEYGTVTSYTVAPSLLVRQLCASSGGLTRAEWAAHIPAIPYRRTC